MRNIGHALKWGFVVGTFDILAACLQFYLKTHKEPSVVFKFIASGVFGSDAFLGGTAMVLAGLVFHYIIAIGFTLIFFLIYPYMQTAFKNNLLIGVIYGILVWSVMKFLILPISSVPPQPFTYTGAAIAIGILIMCIGLPLSLLAVKERKN